MKRLNLILTVIFILSLFSCQGLGKLPFKGSGFGGPQNDNEALIAKTINKTPIVFVHGYMVTASFWGIVRDFFLKNGYSPHELFAVDFKNLAIQKIFKDVAQLDDFIKKVLKYTGKSKVILVAHSRGGLIARVYIKMYKGYDFVEKCILIASPALGAPRTGALYFVHPKHPFMINLNKPDANVNKVKFMCIAAENDYIFPTRYTFLDYAKNIKIQGTDHISVARDKRTLKEILKFIES
jgi:pimeloyl-ACP methyl ester carboxylesterase